MSSTSLGFCDNTKRDLLLRSFLRNDSGATAIEYGLIVSLIFLAIVGAVQNYTNSTSDMYNEISSTLND